METIIIKVKDDSLLEENKEESDNTSKTKSIIKIEENPELKNKSSYDFSECMKQAEEQRKNENYLYDDANPIEFENKIQKLSFKGNLIFIKKIKNSYFILVYQDNLIIVDNELKNEKDLIIEKTMINNICVREENEEIIICTKNGTKLLTFNDRELESNKNLLEQASYSCAEFSNNNLIICEKKGVFHYHSLFDITNEDKNPYPISDKSYRGVIAIDENLAAITSNKYIDNGEDKLLIYRLDSKQLIQDIIGYSFNLNSNALSLISNKKNKNKILLCACKKNEKNGILYINIKKDEPKFNFHFIETKGFEVFCFCQLYTKSDKIFNYNYEENATNNILVGGLNHKKMKGEIKVYKIEDNEITSVENSFYNEIIKESKSAINNIIQNKNNQKIIIGNFDGNICLLDTPDIND